MSNIIKNNEAGAETAGRKFEMEEIAENCREMVASAKAEAERVLAQARTEAERVRDAAYRQGWETGKREATEKLEAEIRGGLAAQYGKQVEEVVQALKKMMSDLATEREPLLKTTRDDMVKLALRIAKMVIKKECEAPGEVARLNLEEAIEHSAHRTELVALVNERDLKTLELVLGELTELAGPRSSVKLVADPDMLPGGCVVRSTRGEVDATIETQLGEIERALINS